MRPRLSASLAAWLLLGPSRRRSPGVTLGLRVVLARREGRPDPVAVAVAVPVAVAVAVAVARRWPDVSLSESDAGSRGGACRACRPPGAGRCPGAVPGQLSQH